MSWPPLHGTRRAHVNVHLCNFSVSGSPKNMSSIETAPSTRCWSATNLFVVIGSATSAVRPAHVSHHALYKVCVSRGVPSRPSSLSRHRAASIVALSWMGMKKMVHSWMLRSCQSVNSDNVPNSLDLLLFCLTIFTQRDDVDTALLVHCDLAPVDPRWPDAMSTLSSCVQMSQHLRCHPKRLRRSKELLHAGDGNRHH